MEKEYIYCGSVSGKAECKLLSQAKKEQQTGTFPGLSL